MIVLSKKCARGLPDKLLFWCPACDEVHGVFVDGEEGPNRPLWSWNQDIERPTISPSVRVRGVGVCHFFLREGKLDYCSDSTHQLAGKVVDLPDLPDWFIEGM